MTYLLHSLGIAIEMAIALSILARLIYLAAELLILLQSLTIHYWKYGSTSRNQGRF